MSRQRARDGGLKRAAHFVQDDMHRNDPSRVEDLCSRPGCTQSAILDWEVCSSHSFSRNRTSWKGVPTRKRRRY